MSEPVVGTISVLVDASNSADPEYTIMYPETVTSQILDFDKTVNDVLINNVPNILENNTVTIKSINVPEGIISDKDNIVSGFISNAEKDINGNTFVDYYATKLDVDNAVEANINIFDNGTYKGQCASFTELPLDAQDGDVYKVVYNNTSTYYVFRNSAWATINKIDKYNQIINYINTLETRVSTLETENSSLKTQINSIASMTEAFNSRISTLEQQVTAQGQQIEALTQA